MSADEIPSQLDGPGSRPWRSDTCWNCRHLNVLNRTCAAFLNGIPDELWQAYRGHRQPYPGDQGIQFAERPLPEPLRIERYDIPDFLRRKPDPP